MKKITFLLFTILSIQFTTAQETNSVEKSIFGVQTGVLGVWAYNESRLSDNIALRTEIGLNLSLFDSFFIEGGTKTLWSPVIRLEPRWYYNLNRRLRNG